MFSPITTIKFSRYNLLSWELLLFCCSRCKQIVQAERRIAELSKLFKRMYEDNVNGKLSDIRFEKLSGDYEAEQADLENKPVQWQAELTEQEQHTEEVERFIRKCRQYADMTELTPIILNDLVSKVFVESPLWNPRISRTENVGKTFTSAMIGLGFGPY